TDVTLLGSPSPVSQAERVPSSDPRRGPVYDPGRRPLWWRRPAAAVERDAATMERRTSHTSAQRPSVTAMTEMGATRTARPWSDGAAGGGRMRSSAALAVVLGLMALGAGLFGLLSQRTHTTFGGQTASTPGVTPTPTMPGAEQTQLPNASAFAAYLPLGSHV